jgi:hypothetical protein
MASIPQKRDRHGRGMRRPVPSKLFRHGLSRQTLFQDAVADTADYLRSRFPEELGALNWKIEEVPLQERPESLNRWHTRPQTMTIIERSASSKTSDPRIQIEQAVVSAAASLLGKDPWDLLDQ